MLCLSEYRWLPDIFPKGEQGIVSIEYYEFVPSEIIGL